MPFTNKPGTGGGGGTGITSIGLTDGTTATSTLTTGAGVFGIIPGEGMTSSVTGFNIELAATGSGRKAVRNVDSGLSPAAVSTDNYFILCDVSGGDVTLRLPSIGASNIGDTWVVIDTGSAGPAPGSNQVIIDAATTAGTTINGSGTLTISTAQAAVNIMTDGTVFRVY